MRANLAHFLAENLQNVQKMRFWRAAPGVNGSKAPSTPVHFQTKTELFCSLSKKICVHTSRVCILFARPHYDAVSVLKTLLSILMTSPFSDSIVFSVHTRKQRFQIAPLWRAFSNGSVFGDRFRRCSVDDSRIRSKTAPFSFENGLVWTGPKSVSELFGILVVGHMT